jgi:hypothetical protein
MEPLRGEGPKLMAFRYGMDIVLALTEVCAVHLRLRSKSVRYSSVLLANNQ